MNQRIERQVRAHFRVPEAVTVTVGALKPSEFSGYDTLPITIDDGNQKNTIDFLLSKDGKKLVRLANIISVLRPMPGLWPRTPRHDASRPS